MKQLTKLLGIISLATYISSCKPVPVSHWFPATPQEKYERELYKIKAEESTAGQTWFKAGKNALKDTLFSNAPHQERFFLGDSLPAQAVRLKIPEGRQLVITPLREQQDTVSRLFLELYRIKTNGEPQRIEYLKENEDVLIVSDHQSDTLLIRLQTGLNEKLIVSLSLTTLPTLGFPIAGYGMQNVISSWGAERERGTRSHEGIDIKAPRGTPAIASQNGLVTQTGTNNLGGKVVFLSAMDSPYSLYYAHLDSQLVSVGQRVKLGDTLGLVGNTGNAITTTPHLHFGIYGRRSGAVDPFPFINDRKEKIAGLSVVSRWIGDTVRIKTKANLYASSTFTASDKILILPKNERIRVVGELPKGFRVQLADGTIGYIQATGFISSDKKFTSANSR